MLIGTPAAFLLVRSADARQVAAARLRALADHRAAHDHRRRACSTSSRVGLVGTSFGLAIGHTVIAVPYVVMTMMAVLRNYDTRLDLAAQSLGATPWQTLRHVTFPILGAGLFSSFLFAFATSFDELTISLFASGGLTSTLPKQFWDEVTLSLAGDRRRLDLPLRLPRPADRLAEWLRRRSASACPTEPRHDHPSRRRAPARHLPRPSDAGPHRRHGRRDAVRALMRHVLPDRHRRRRADRRHRRVRRAAGNERVRMARSAPSEAAARFRSSPASSTRASTTRSLPAARSPTPAPMR